MSQYAKAVEKLNEQKAQTAQRTDYRCKARGCPNTGTIQDKCYFHWQAADSTWPAVTQWIQENFHTARNHGPWEPRPDTVAQREMKARMRAGRHQNVLTQQTVPGAARMDHSVVPLDALPPSMRRALEGGPPSDDPRFAEAI